MPEYRGMTVDNLDAAVTELRAKGAEIAVGPEGVMVELVQR